MPASHQTSRFIHAYILGISLVVFFIDIITALGFAEWILYAVPVVLCLRSSNPHLPVLTVVGLVPLLVAGYFLSPEGVTEVVSVFNRALALLTVVGIGALVRRTITDRLRAQRLMWLERGRSEVARNILGELTVSDVSEQVLHALARYMDAQIGAFYRLEGSVLVRTAGFALDVEHSSDRIPVGSGIVGEVARSGQADVLTDVPGDYLRVNSATGEALPAQLLVAPFTVDGKVYGVMEFGFLRKAPLDEECELVGLAAENIGSAVRSAEYRQHLKELLDETRRQSEELQAQQEELRVANEELTEQAAALQKSQAEMESQHAELEQINDQLEERNRLLEEQKRRLAAAQEAVERHAEQLERASRYKSEFLANMSHELRTPLNSSLILSSVLAENKSGTLTEEQVRYARTIHAANSDLLALINDILDLSKIEAGKVDLNREPVAIEAVMRDLRQTFEPLAADKGLALHFEADSGAPATLHSDRQRVQQVLRNLLSNAIKFTHAGEVRLTVSGGEAGRVFFAVSDTGIGIAPEQQDAIFEAFRQADGSTNRTYGGTGLGLSISRELAHLLGGEITLRSKPGAGSTFVLDIPVDLVSDAAPAAQAPAAAIPQPPATPVAHSHSHLHLHSHAPAEPVAETGLFDDRDNRSRERIILVIEDDEKFARILYELAHEMGFDCLVAATGAEAIRLAEQFRPSGILLDVGLPDQSGLGVLERIKRNPATRHLPVHVISVSDYMQAAFELGAVGYALKPVAREQIVEAISRLDKVMRNEPRRVLIVEDNAALGESLAAMLRAEDIEITNARTVAQALDRLSANTYDCMVMDLMLPDGSGFDLLEHISRNGKYAFPPVIVYTGRELSRDEEQKLQRYARSIIIKGARSPERLLDEVTLFLHRVEAALPPDQQQMLQQARQRDAAFEGRRILIAEDDVRNVFALTSIFEPLGATLVIARNGKEALARLEEGPVDLVLMDVMMPGMDGLTAIRELRKKPGFKRLPVIALTAKAMADDRRNSLDAGASDYIAKPIVVEQLLSLCRVWMPKQEARGWNPSSTSN